MPAQAVYFKQLQLGPMQNFVYLIGDPQTRQAAVVDPGWEVPVILETLRSDGYRPVSAIVTHHHFDHVMGLGELLEAADLPVYVHHRDAAALELSRSSLKPTDGGQRICVGELAMTLIHTPGHTEGSQCLLVDGRLLSGDTLFIGACGRCDLPGGDPAKLYDSLAQRLRPLPDDTLLCPGHHYAAEPTTQLGHEKRTNPFLRAASVQEFFHLVGAG